MARVQPYERVVDAVLIHTSSAVSTCFWYTWHIFNP